MDENRSLFTSLAKLIKTHSIAKEIAYFAYNKGFSPISSFNIGSNNHDVDVELLKASLSYLVCDPNTYRAAWDWNQMWSLMEGKSDEIRWLSLQIIRVLCSFSDQQYYQMCDRLFPTGYGSYQIQFSDIYSSKLSASAVTLERSVAVMLNRYSTKIFGHYMMKYDLQSSNPPSKSDIVVVNSVENNLNVIAAAITDNVPVIVEGPLGSGKTALIEYLASLTGRKSSPSLTKIQISNQFDSKILIGSHCCTEVVGEFVWKPGPLTDAIANGHWLVFEDIDLATPDVITLLQSVIKSKSLAGVPNCLTPPTVDPRFRLFFTRRTADGLSEFFSNADKELILKLCRSVTLSNYTLDEISSIISSKYPRLNDPAKGSAWEGVLRLYDVINNCNNSSTGRRPSFRDLLKWCDRVEKYFTLESSPAQQKNYFLDASDCFLQCDPKLESRMEKVEKIGPIFGINCVNSKNLMKEKPRISAKRNASSVVIGRIELDKTINSDQVNFSFNELTFSYTLQSLSLLEKIACCVKYNEPVLLVGETGVGKTKTVQYLCNMLEKQLTVINMNQQSESSDLLGGFKPMDLPNTLKSIKTKFQSLFFKTFTTSSAVKLKKFSSDFDLLFAGENWFDKNANSIFDTMLRLCEAVRHKAEKGKSKCEKNLLEDWKKLHESLEKLKHEAENTDSPPTIFTYVEGSLLKAMRNGEWILLDEINLAESETLQCLSSILDSKDEQLIIYDKADNEPLQKHADFRLFACMNPSSDVGKKDLPLGIRHRFTEFFVEELEYENDLQIIVEDYLKAVPSVIKQRKGQIVKFYLEVREMCKTELKDATGGVPHFTLRTLCRALQAISDCCCFTKESHPSRIIYEAFCLSFLTQLSLQSKITVENLIVRRILGAKSVDAIIKLPLKPPKSDKFIEVNGYFLPKGTEKPFTDKNYKVSVKSVARNLRDVSRIISLGRSYPILIQGETSVGKTSLIKYLANLTGNVCLRVNNHEHTDIQEYIGCYTNDDKGKLVFQEGILVEAMRKGYWIILDELNLASTEVLESLNRVLDENRELFIAETQKTVQALPNFLVFATQNPPGHYGGRKLLSRAFRNRFIELHFDEIPREDLIVILQERCDLSPSYAQKMVTTLYELRHRLHQSVSLSFAGKHGGVTLRDLFRWGERYRQFQRNILDKFYDWKRYLAIEGYFLFAGRSRVQLEVEVIIEVLKKQFGIKDFDPIAIIDEYFAQLFPEINLPDKFNHIYWTFSLKRTAVLFFRALQFKEPALLVGETGCGKTTICELFSTIKKHQEIYSVNCHMHSESADFLGRLSSVETEGNHRFEWIDGPLVKAMRNGCMFMIDEISLADDSVLERLNSVIEPERTLLLTEKSFNTDQKVIAHENFDLVATMNPGGDHGKKELSPALRNRFTEIWCYSSNDIVDINNIVQHNLASLLKKKEKTIICKILSQFFEWFFIILQKHGQTHQSIRDVLAITSFIKHSMQSSHSNYHLDPVNAIRHAIDLVYLDSHNVYKVISDELSPSSCRSKLEAIITSLKPNTKAHINELKIKPTQNLVGIEPFFIHQGPHFKSFDSVSFVFDAESVGKNVYRLLRAMQLSKPILIEGPPGVGKTSLVQSLAEATGHDIIRINLSEQTDIHDLFGSKLPRQGSVGEFEWRNGPLLAALQSNSCWILLDEMNLASQSVLEGLNACFDHRGEIFIPELGESFKVNKELTRIFACQNPHAQGGDRKGLPKSFLNRFTVIYMDSLTSSDHLYIVENSFKNIPKNIIQQMVSFNDKINQEISTNITFARLGLPWEFNLRDIFRWCKFIQQNSSKEITDDVIYQGANLVYIMRMRSESDRQIVKEIFQLVFGFKAIDAPIHVNIYPDYLQIGNSFIKRVYNRFTQNKWTYRHEQARTIEALIKSISINSMVLLVGPSQSGKSSCVNILSRLAGIDLKVISVNSETDTIELLGGFDQNDVLRDLLSIQELAEQMIWNFVSTTSCDPSKTRNIRAVLKAWFKHKSVAYTNLKTHHDFTQHCDRMVKILTKIDTMKDSTIFKKLEDLRKYVLNRQSLTSKGAFQWIDSVLIDAVREGVWLLIDDVNLCSASVLDRLNGLLEPNGELILNEQGFTSGTIPRIKPHPSFRLFLTINPKNGELSRAMRNRAIEISIISPATQTPPPATSIDTAIIMMTNSEKEEDRQTDNFIIKHLKESNKIDELDHLLGDVIASNFYQHYSMFNSFLSSENFSSLEVLSFVELFFALSTNSDLKLRFSLASQLEQCFKKDLETCMFTQISEHLKHFTFKCANLDSLWICLKENLPLDIRYHSCFWDNLIVTNLKEIQTHLNTLPLALFKHKLLTIQQITSQSSSKCLHNSEKLTQFPVIQTLLQIFHQLGINGLCDDDLYFSTRKIAYWIHDFIMFTLKDLTDSIDNRILFDSLLVRWVLLSHKLHSSHIGDINCDIFTNFNKLLALPASLIDNFIVEKKNLKSIITLAKCPISAAILDKSFKLSKAILSSHSFCDLNCDNRSILNSLVDIYQSLYTSSLPLEELEQSLQILDNNLRSKNASIVCDKDELNDQQLMKSFNQRIFNVQRKIAPLNCAQFFFAQLQSMIDLSSSKEGKEEDEEQEEQGEGKKEEADISSICLHPMHSFLYKKFDKNSSELLLHHLLDFYRIFRLCELRKMRLASSSSSSSSKIKSHEKEEEEKEGEDENDYETSEWQTDGYALELTPFIAYTFCQILSTNYNIAEISVKREQYSMLQQFIASNYTNLCNFNFFNHQFTLITDQVLQEKQSIVAYTEKKISSSSLFDSLFYSLNQSSQLPEKAKHLLLLGTVLTHYRAPTMLIDPLQKWCVKLEQHCLELEYIEKELLMHKMYLLVKTGLDTDPQFAHPHVKQIMERRMILLSKIDKLKQRQGYRPIPSQYQRLRQQVNHFLNSKLSLEKMFTRIENFERILDPSNNLEASKEINDCINLIKSIQSFIDTLMNTFTLYYDITNGMILGIIITLNGLKVYHHLMARKSSSIWCEIKLHQATVLEDVGEIMILSNPNPIKKAQKVISLVKTCTCLIRCTNTSLDIGKNSALLYKSALLDLQNSLHIDMLKINNDQKSILQCLTSIVESFCEAWNLQEEEKKRMLAEEESIYQYKTKVHQSDLPGDVQDELDIIKRFPSYEQEFSDDTTEGKQNQDEKEEDSKMSDHMKREKNSIELRPEDIMDIHQLHEQVLEAILSSKLSNSTSYSAPVVYRFKFLTNFLDIFYPLFDEKLNMQSAESALLICSTLNENKSPTNCVQNIKINFYQDPCPSQLQECFTILETLKEKIFHQLLPMSPGDPILHQILFVIDKIYDLPSDSPLAKCVAGLEQVLSVEMAHWKVRLNDQIASITNLVLKWRKIQLSNWSLLLDTVLEDIKCVQISRFWFYFFSFIHPMLTIADEDNLKNRKQLASILRKFLEQSNLGEFECRLNLIKNFINHQLCIDISRSHAKLFFVLKNVYSYFDQFRHKIADEISNIKSPIDKELKDCAKIMKWNDCNLDNLKNETKKAHRTLHRLTKNFTKSLAISTSKLLTLQFKINSTDLKTPITGQKQNEENEEEEEDVAIAENKEEETNFTKDLIETSYPECQNLSRFIKYAAKVDKVCKRIKKRHARMVDMCIEIDEKTVQIIENEEELDKLKISSTIKEKSAYNKEWKSINNMKRQSLSMTLKQLIESGLSYRKGIDYYNCFDIEHLFLTANPLHCQYSAKIDNSVDIDTCNTYFYQCLYRFSDFTNSLSNPSHDIKSVRNVFDKMKGIVGYLLHGITTSRQDLSDFLSLLQDLSQLKKSIVSVSTLMRKPKRISSSSTASFFLANPVAYEKWRKILASKYSSLLHLLHQMSELSSSLSIQLKFNFDFDSLLNVHNFPAKKMPGVDIVTRDNMIELEKSWTKVNLLSKQIHEMLCKTEYSKYSLPHHLIQICDEISSNYGVFMKEKETLEFELDRGKKRRREEEKDEDEGEGEEEEEEEKKDDDDEKENPLRVINSATEETLKCILMDIQKLFKSSKRFSSKNETTRFTSKDFIPMLTVNLWDKIDISRVIHAIKQIIDYISSKSFLYMKSGSYKEKEEACKVLLRLATLLQSYYHLLDYLAQVYTKSLLVRSKFLCSILYLFTTHCQKGFRLPPPFVDDDNTHKKLDNSKLKNIQDAGLGEGEGIQDVSKKIENEDQLEDALPEEGECSKELNEDDEKRKDLKSEKDAIEMSDDFDAPEYGPDDQDDNVGSDDGKSDRESDEQSDDLEKKMGDVENENLEDLDDKMWGSEDDEDASGDDLDYDGGGKDADDDDDENRLVAKDENIGLDKKKEKEKEKEKLEKKNNEDKEINNSEEINEMKIDEDEQDDYQGEREDPYKHPELLKDKDSGKNVTDDQDKELPEEMQLDKDENGSDNDDASMNDEDDTEKMQDSNAPSLTDIEPEDINLDDDTDNRPIQEEEMKDVEKEKELDSEVEMLLEEEEQQPSPDVDMNQINETCYPDHLKIETTEITPDSGIQNESNVNVQKDPFYDRENRNINENSDLTPHSIDEDEKKSDTGGSQQKGLESESLEGKIRSKSIHDESSGREEDENVSKPEMIKKEGQRSLSENSSKPSKRQKILERYESNIEEKDEKESLTEEEEENKKKDRKKKGEEEEEENTKSGLVQHCLEKEKNNSKHEATDLSEEYESRKSRPAEEEEKDADEKSNEKEIEDEEKKKKDESKECLSRSEQMEIDSSIDQDEIKSIRASIDVNRQGNKDQRKHDIGKSNDDDNEEMVESIGDVVETACVQRGPESQYNTSIESDDKCDMFYESWFDKLQHKLEKCTVTDQSIMDICRDAWFECEKTVSPLVYELCQQLQMILEPMKAAKMRGDFRTGKRLNMRKVIEYIASGYKKDKIWLRRTKPSKREYQIVLAIDDSSSMIDNQAKRMAFESIALLAKSLSLLDAGQLSVMSFGDDVKLLSSFDDTFTDLAGLSLLSQLNFDQKSTDIVALLDSASGYFVQNQSRRHSISSSIAISQLLIIISDGRGINNKRGEKAVKQSVQYCRQLGIFVLFIVLDNMQNNQSILDIVKPIQADVTSYTLERYMDSFPFPYYIILRDIMNMPKILGEALRKWFEMVTSSDR